MSNWKSQKEPFVSNILKWTKRTFLPKITEFCFLWLEKKTIKVLREICGWYYKLARKLHLL